MSKPRFALTAALSAAALFIPANALAAVPARASAQHAITLITSENPITYGDQLVLYGRVTGPHTGGRVVTLWHRVNGVSPIFTPIQQTTTNAAGFYAFQRLADVVDSNREYYVASPGAGRSRTVFERVVDVVTLTGPPSGTPLTTGRPATVFTGTVAPAGRRQLRPAAAPERDRQRAVVGDDPARHRRAGRRVHLRSRVHPAGRREHPRARRGQQPPYRQRLAVADV